MTATLTIPDRTMEQRMKALRHANQIRSQRARIKRALRNGHLTPATVLFSLDHDWLHTMRVETVLLATPKLGRVKVNRALQACRISPSRTIQGLTERQGVELLRYLEERWPTVEVGSNGNGGRPRAF